MSTYFYRLYKHKKTLVPIFKCIQGYLQILIGLCCTDMTLCNCVKSISKYFIITYQYKLTSIMTTRYKILILCLRLVSFDCDFHNRVHFASSIVASLKLHNRQHPLAFALDLQSHNRDVDSLSLYTG